MLKLHLYSWYRYSPLSSTLPYMVSLQKVTVLNAIVKIWVRKCSSDSLVSTLEQVKQECVYIPLYISIAWIISKWSGYMPLLSFLPTQKEKTRSFLMPVLWTCYHKLGVVFKELFVVSNRCHYVSFHRTCRQSVAGILSHLMSLYPTSPLGFVILIQGGCIL